MPKSSKILLLVVSVVLVLVVWNWTGRAGCERPAMLCVRFLFPVLHPRRLGLRAGRGKAGPRLGR